MSTTVGDAAWLVVPATVPRTIGGGGGTPAVMVDSSGGLANI